jgi:hypothetical protein
MKDGRLNKCKDCTKAAVIANRIAKIDHYRGFDRARANLPHRVKARAEYQQTDAYKLVKAISTKRWAVANALRRKAQHAVNNAIRDGRLIKQPCFVCGSNAHAHHPDYAKLKGVPPKGSPGGGNSGAPAQVAPAYAASTPQRAPVTGKPSWAQ